MLRSQEDGVSSTFAFIVAVGVMLGSVAVVYQATGDVASQGVLQETEQVNLQSEAAALKQILIDSPGVVTGGGPWDQSTNTSDTIERLGLLSPDGAGIQLEKLRNLRLAPFEADPTDGYANYEEVKTALGLDDKGLDFHIRAKPTLKSVEEILNDPDQRDQQLKVTYIGNVSEIKTNSAGDEIPIDEGLVVSDFQCEVSPASSTSYRFSVNITNGGSTSTQFYAAFDIINGDTTVTRHDQSGLIPAGDTDTVHVDVVNSDDVDCNGSTKVQVEVLDPVQSLRTETLDTPDVGGSATSSPDNKDFYVQAGNPYYETNDTIRLSYYGDVSGGDDLNLTIRSGTDPAGPIVYGPDDFDVPNGNGQRDVDVAASALGGTGTFTAYLTHELGIMGTQRILVMAAGSEPDAYTPPGVEGEGTYDEDPAMAVEVDFLHSLAERFCPAYYDKTTVRWVGGNDTWSSRCSHFKTTDALWDGTVHSGDVVPDLQKDLWDLEAKLLLSGTPRYDLVNTLVVGSNVAHNSMTSNNFGEPLEQWVLGGGTLIVFGSPDQSTQWLQNLFHAGQTSSSGGISAPDVSHPLLSTPEPLAYDEYDTSGKGWKYTGGADEHFTDVVEQGGTPITAVSDPGDFGEGTIVLTSWLPYDLFGTGAGTAETEGLRLMYNFMMQGYRDLFLDYGPPLPDGVPAIPAAGRSYVDHPDLGQLTLDFTLYVFPSA